MNSPHLAEYIVYSNGVGAASFRAMQTFGQNQYTLCKGWFKALEYYSTLQFGIDNTATKILFNGAISASSSIQNYFFDQYMTNTTFEYKRWYNPIVVLRVI